MKGYRPTKLEIEERIWRLQSHLRAQRLAGALLVQNVDRYYFTGTMQGGWVLVPAEGEPLVLIRKDPERAGRESPLPVEPVGSVREVPERIRARVGEIPSPLGLELDVLPVSQLERLKAMLPGSEFGDASRAILMTRAVKSSAEVDAIRGAARVVAEAVETVPGHLKAGISEIELSARIEQELRRRGHGGFTRMRGFNQEMFYGHVFGGATAATPSFLDAPTGGLGLGPAVPQGPSLRILEPGEPVVLDLVGNFQGYLSDQTRVFSLGSLREPFGAALEAALAVERSVVEVAAPGVSAARLYETAVRVAEETPFGGHFLGQRQKVSFVGHGIGLEVDEYPFLARGFDLPLEEGMVFALEPKFIFEGEGVVGVEDTFVVTAAGVERLTPSPQGLRVV